jgi:hypothetical protein
MYFTRSPSFAQATNALATCPPGLKISRSKAVFPA